MKTMNDRCFALNVRLSGKRILLISFALLCLLAVSSARAQFGFATQPKVSAEGDALFLQGLAAYKAGRIGEAISDYERARAIYTQQLGANDLSTLNDMSNLANAYNAAGRTNDALTTDEQVYAIKRSRFGDENSITLFTTNNLALDYRMVGRYDEALKLDQQILDVRRRTLGPNHPDTLKIMSMIASLYMVMGRHDDSVKLNEETLAAQRSTLGPDNLATISTMNNLAASYLTVGRGDDAVKLAEQALAQRRSKLGADHPDTIASMSVLAQAYVATGRKAEGIALDEQVVSLRRAKFGEEDVRTLTTESRVAGEYEGVGRKEDAIKLQEHVVGTMRRKLGDDNAMTQETVNSLATFYVGANRQGDAVKLREQVIETLRHKLGDDNTLTLANMNSLAILYDQSGKHDDAIRLCQEMVATSRKKFGEDAPETLTSMTNLTVAYQTATRDRDAAKVNEELLAIQRRKLGADSPATLQTMVQLSQNYGSMGRFDDRIKLNEEAYKLSRNKSGSDAPPTLTSMSSLATAYSQAGRTADALKLEEELVAIRRSKPGTDNEALLDNLTNLANIYASLGRYADAAKLNEEVLADHRKRLGDSDPKTLVSMGNLATNYHYLGRFNDALRLVEQVYRERQSRLGDENRDTLEAKLNLAGIYLSLGRLNDAQALATQVLSTMQRQLGPTAPDTVTAMNNLARIDEAMKRPDEALKLDQQTLEARRKMLGDEHPDTLYSMYHLANDYFAVGRKSEAASLRRETLDDIEKRAVSLKSLTREERSTALGFFTIYYARFAQELAADPSGFTEALTVVERAKARSLLEELTAREAISNSGISSAEAKQLNDLRGSIEYLDGKLEATTDDGARDALRKQRDHDSSDLNALQQRLMAQYPRYAALSVVKPVTLDEARKQLPGDGAFISLLFNVSGSGVALALPSNGNLSVVKLDPGLEMIAHAFTYRWLMALPDADSFMRAAQATPLAAWQLNGTLYIGAPDHRPADGKSVSPSQYVTLRQQAITEHGQWLSDTFLKPLAPQIDSSTKWIISPDGVLATIPWDTLPWKGAQLGQQKQITIVQSLSVYRLLKAREAEYANARASDSAHTQPLMVMGGAVYDVSTSQQQQRSYQRSTEEVVEAPTSVSTENQTQNAYDFMRSRHWPNLAGTLAEAQALHALMGGAIFTGRNASKAELRQLSSSGELATFQNLHFAAHGYLDTTVPSLSALVLTATGTDEANDGYITAGEWPSFILKSDLLVMSACETGLGKIVSGEGVQGLPYALYVAGNRDTLLSLWQVSDEGTSVFMKRFWGKVKNGETHAQALAETKLEFQRGDEGSTYSQAYYWAPFVLYGVQD